MLKLAGHTLIFDGDLTITKFQVGEVHAVPEHTTEYMARAAELGYGTAIGRMSRDHEVTHALLAKWFGLYESPTLLGVARKSHWKHWQKEEAAVLALQAFANAVDVNLIRLAEEISE